jgi:hypothetical protein
MKVLYRQEKNQQHRKFQDCGFWDVKEVMLLEIIPTGTTII